MTNHPNKFIKKIKIGAKIKETLIACEGYKVSFIKSFIRLLLVVIDQENQQYLDLHVFV
jgi:hypothetical protein